MYDSGNNIKQSESSKQHYPSFRIALLRVNRAYDETAYLLTNVTS